MTYRTKATAVMSSPIQVSPRFVYNDGNSGKQLAVVQSGSLLVNPTNGVPKRFLEMEQAQRTAEAINTALNERSSGLPDVFSPQTLESGEIIVVSDQLAITDNRIGQIISHANCINDLLVRVP